MSARSRRPTRLSVGMLSNSWRASSGERIGVRPRLTTCLGPRTTEAGLLLTTWPTTSQSNSMRTAARCCLTLGAACDVAQLLDVGRDMHRLEAA